MKRIITLLFGFIPALNSISQQVTGLLGAFPPELALLQQKMQGKKDTLIQQLRFTTGTLNGRAIVLAQTGVGKVNAAIATILMIEHFNPHEILFSGIAGGIDTSLAPGDIVIATSIAYHDYGIVTDSAMTHTPSRNAGSLLPNPLYFPCDTNLVNLAITAAGKLNLDRLTRNQKKVPPLIKKGIIVTGDVFVSADVLTKHLRNEMHAAATEMEGAAIAQTCWQQQVPFLIIRSLSDKADGKAKKDMLNFLQVAAQNAAMLVAAIVGELAKLGFFHRKT